MEQFQNKLWFILYFFLGIIFNNLFPREVLLKKLKKLFFRIVYRKINTFSLKLLKLNQKEIMYKLVRLSELTHNTGVANTTLSLFYEKENKIRSINIYEYSAMGVVSPDTIGVTYDSSETLAMINWITSSDFPGHFFYPYVSDNNVDSLGVKSFQATVGFPKIVNNKILFILHLNYTNLLREESGNIIEPKFTSYQLARVEEIKDQIYNLIIQ